LGVPLLFTEEFEVVIMIGRCRPKRCMGRTEFPTWEITSEPGLEKAKPSTRAKWRSSPSARWGVREKCLTPPTLSERRF